MIRILKRFFIQIIKLITLIIASSAISFLLMEISPIDPIQAYVGAGTAISSEQRENISEYWGLDKPPLERLQSWETAILKGDFGISLTYRKPVLNVIKERFLNSLALMGVSWLFSGLIGFILGIIMAIFNNKLIDKFIKVICLVLSSTPTFWLGLLFLLFFSVHLGWFPLGFSVPIGKLSNEITFLERLYHIVLPSLTLSMISFSNIALHTRTELIEVLSSDYVLFAKARGENIIQIVFNHGIRNIIIPIITLQFASFSELFGGSVLAEQVFSYSGLGQATVQAGLRGDVPLLLGITIFSAIFVFSGNMTANILYELLNPEMRRRGND